MSRRGSGGRKAMTPARFEDQGYVLVQFLEDGLLRVLLTHEIQEKGPGETLAKFDDGQQYKCTILGRSDDKETLLKKKRVLENEKPGKMTDGKRKTPAKNHAKKCKTTDSQPKKGAKRKGAQEETVSDGSDSETDEEVEKKRKEEETKKKKEQKEKDKEIMTSHVDNLLVRMKQSANERFDDLDDLNDLDGFHDDQINLDNRFSDEDGFADDLVESAAEILAPPLVHHFTPVTSTAPRHSATYPSQSVVTKQPSSAARPSRPSTTATGQLQNMTMPTGRPSSTTTTPTGRPSSTTTTPTGRPSSTTTTPTGRPRNSNTIRMPLATLQQNQTQHPSSSISLEDVPHCYSTAVTRPTIGQKCPRRPANLPTVNGASSREDEECGSCKRLRQENIDLKRQLQELVENIASEPPRPGKVHPVLADRFQMVQLTPGSGIYVYQGSLDNACTKRSGTGCAAFLLNLFYSNEELLGRNLTGANGKGSIHKDILDSIIDYTVKAHPREKPSSVRSSLRNNLSNLWSRAAQANAGHVSASKVAASNVAATS